MNRVEGRNIYIVDLDVVVHSIGGPAEFAEQCRLSKLSAIWVRLGRGLTLDLNFTIRSLAEIRTELAKVSVAVWGWHVPHCEDQAAAQAEADSVITWADTHSLGGVLLDAEQTSPGNKNYFLGTAAEAITYAHALRTSFEKSGRGLALSSHDQPHLHGGFPFKEFLAEVMDNCPQLYYTKNVADRLDPSVADYSRLEASATFKDRYKPVGNITVFDDIPLPSAHDCCEKTKELIRLVHANGFQAYAFWCWDEAPPALWRTLHTTPV
jgi:hypothetical protein